MTTPHRARFASKPPVVLAIGGLDPGGGAGLLADARAIHACDAFACAVVALETVQSTAGLKACRVLAASWVIAQAEELRCVQRIDVIKLGALGSVANVRGVARWLSRRAATKPMVLDPVVLPSRGRMRLLAPRAVAALRDDLLPLATLVTPNAPEAALLTSTRVATLADARSAARALLDLGARAALVKGGHLEPGGDVIDVLAVGRSLIELRSRRLALPGVHGGGCTLASLIAARLAHAGPEVSDDELVLVVRSARRHHQRALLSLSNIGGPTRALVP